VFQYDLLCNAIAWHHLLSNFAAWYTFLFNDIEH